MSVPFPERFILDVARRAGRTLVPTSNPDEILIACPWGRQHRNGDAHPSCRLNGAKNVFYCDPCGRGGGVVDLAEALGVEVGSPSGGAQTTGTAKTRVVFVSAGRVTESTRQHFAESLGKSYAPSTWNAFAVLEGTVHFEGAPARAEDAVAFPLPIGGVHVYRYRRPERKRRWCFANGGRADVLIAGLDREGPVIFAEGEWDAMRAHELGYAVATGTGAGTFRIEWASRLAGREVVVCYDVDPAGKSGASKALAALKDTSRARLLELPLSGDLETDGKDLSDFVAVHGPEAFHRLVTESRPVNTDQSAAAGSAGSSSAKTPVAPLIDAVLAMEGPVRLKRREATRLIIEDLTRHGDLIHAVGGRQFWFDRSARQLLQLDEFPFRSTLISRYDINPAEPEFRHIVEGIRSHTLDQGRRVEVYRFAHFDRSGSRLYLSAGPGRVLRLDGERVTSIDHGEDGVLFEGSPAFDVIPDGSIDASAADSDWLHDLVLSRVNFTRGSGVILSVEQQRMLLRVWTLAVFFPELLPAKALLLLYGEKGSGKTTTIRVILKLLLGPTANVTPLAKEDGFNAAVSQEYLLALDNVDSFCRWIEDRLATVATGQTIKLRKLYTTNEMISFPTRCAIALTARTPRFRRDDVVDRLLILRVSRLEKFSREESWYAEIEQYRTHLWAQLLRVLNGIVSAVRRERVVAPESIRMADWAFLAMTIGRVLGKEEEVKTILEAAELDKAHFLLEADEIYDLLHDVAVEQPDRRWKAGELFAELHRRAEAADIEFRVKSPRSLGRILHRLAPALKRMIFFEISTDTHDGQATYTLGPLLGGHEDDTAA